jgi:lysophospholipase L1-like esterase
LPDDVIPSRTSRAFHLALGVAMAVVVLAVSGCSAGSPSAGGSPADPDDGGRPVLFLGDSLTVGARLWGDLAAKAGAAGWAAEVVAEDGQDVRWGLDQVRARDEVPEVVVVGLGTNPGTSPGTFAEDAASLVDELVARGAGTVVWWPPGDTADAGRASRAAALRAAAASTRADGGASDAGGPLLVPDWPSELARHPGWLAADGIHLTTEGYESLSAFLVAQLADPR